MARLSTGNDSPVSTDSSMATSRASSTTRSAATRSPRSNSTMSPGTTVSAATVRGTPFRSTRTLGAKSARSAATARSARHSWLTPSTALNTTMAPIVAASAQSPSSADTTVPASRIRISGLFSWPRMRDPHRRALRVASALGPSARSRRAASPSVSPPGGVDRRSQAPRASSRTSASGFASSFAMPAPQHKRGPRSRHRRVGP